MKLLIVFACSAALLLAGEAAGTKPASTTKQPAKAAKAPAKAKPAAQAPQNGPEIPAAATQVDAATWRYTDAQGKKWLYRKTPFGVARLEDASEAPSAAAPAPAPAARIVAREEGDTVHFERAGPLGTYRWDKKKSDLDADERAALSGAQQATRKD